MRDRTAKSVAKRKSRWAGGLGQESGDCQISGFGYYIAHGVDEVQVFTLWPEQAFVLSSSRLVYAIDCWPLEADFPFSNKNFFCGFLFYLILKY